MGKTYIKTNMKKACQLFSRLAQENCLLRLQSEFKASPGNLVRSFLKIDEKKGQRVCSVVEHVFWFSLSWGTGWGTICDLVQGSPALHAGLVPFPAAV